MYNYIRIFALLAGGVFLMIGCDSSGSSDSNSSQESAPGEEPVKWEVTGAVTQGDPNDLPFSIVWSIDYADGGQIQNSVRNDADILPWTKEESLSDGTEVTLGISPIPNTINNTTYTLDFELRLFSNSTVVASLDTTVQVPPNYSGGDYPAPPLTYVVGN